MGAWPAGSFVACESNRSAHDCRPSYFAAVASSPEILGQRSKMNNLYLQDVHRLRALNDGIPAHRPCRDQSGPRRCVRIASWNVNNLCGVTAAAAMGTGQRVTAERAMAVIAEFGADVLVLQEALADPKDYDDAGCESACLRVQRLDPLLEANGYSLMRSSHANPVLVATRLPASAWSELNLDDGHEWAERMRSSPGRLKRDAQGNVCVKVNESRPLLYVEVGVGCRSLGVYGAHFHHVNYVDTPEGCRAAEARSFLADANNRSSDVVVLAADFNQPRKQDHPPEEWDIISTANRRFKNPEDDGVARLLRGAGFRASWDQDSAERNFPGGGAPPMTHWTGTTLDFAYCRGIDFEHCHGSTEDVAAAARVRGAYLFFTELSDHLPIVVDIEMPAE